MELSAEKLVALVLPSKLTEISPEGIAKPCVMTSSVSLVQPEKIASNNCYELYEEYAVSCLANPSSSMVQTSKMFSAAFTLYSGVCAIPKEGFAKELKACFPMTQLACLCYFD